MPCTKAGYLVFPVAHRAVVAVCGCAGFRESVLDIARHTDVDDVGNRDGSVPPKRAFVGEIRIISA